MSEKENYLEDEISLRELILKAQEYLSEISRYWGILLIGILIGIGYNLYTIFTTKTTYTANLSFLLKEEQGGGGGVASLLGNFGLGGAGGKYNVEKLVDLLKSRYILEKAIFEKKTIDGKNDFIANHLIEKYFREGWQDNELLANFSFLNAETQKFTETENTALLSIQNLILQELLGTSIRKTEIIELTATTVSTDLSIALVSSFFDNLSKHYIQKTIERQSFTYNISKSRADSVAVQLAAAEFSLAKFQQENKNLRLETDKLTEQRLYRMVTRLSLVYGEAVKNVEIAKFSLENATPFIQELDRPIAPLKKNKPSKIKGILTGLLLGAFFASIYIIGRKIVRDAMRDPNQSDFSFDK